MGVIEMWMQRKGVEQRMGMGWVGYNSEFCTLYKGLVWRQGVLSWSIWIKEPLL